MGRRSEPTRIKERIKNRKLNHMNIIIIILAVIVGMIIGYHFCKMRWRVNDLLELSRIQTSLMCDEISAEEALKRIDGLK